MESRGTFLFRAGITDTVDGAPRGMGRGLRRRKNENEKNGGRGKNGNRRRKKDVRAREGFPARHRVAIILPRTAPRRPLPPPTRESDLQVRGTLYFIRFEPLPDEKFFHGATVPRFRFPRWEKRATSTGRRIEGRFANFLRPRAREEGGCRETAFEDEE